MEKIKNSFLPKTRLIRFNWAVQKLYIASGHDVVTTAAIIGHEDVETTLKCYIAPEKNFEREKVNEIFRRF